MLKVSDAFNSAFAAPDRELRARVTIGKTVYDSDDLTSINYDSGAMTGEQFSIGSTYMNSAKIIFSHLVEGLKQLDEVLVELGVLKPDGTVEYVKMGTFIVDDKIQMDRNNNTTTIECMDRMTMLGGTYVSKLTYPARIKDVAIEIANMAGVKANETSFARLSENKINQPTGYTYRDAIGLIAQFQMGFALFDRDGLLDIRTLQDNSFKIDPNQYFLKGLVKNETFFKLNGISCTVVTTSKDENGNETSKTTVLQSGSSSGAQIKLANNVMTQDVLDRMYEALKFTNYYPFSLNWNGNPAVEAGDWLTVEDLQGNEFKVPNMSYTLTYNGGLTTTSKADTSVSSPATYSYGGSMSNIVNEIGGREGAEGNHIYEGTEDQKPTLSKEGDLWYKHVGPDTEEWIYKDGKWEFLTSTKTANDAQKAADQASKEAGESKKQANKAVDGANDAVAKAGFANDTATQAKSDAAAAQKDATGALNSALDAQSDASIAVTQASSAAADSKDAKQIAGAVSQSYKTLTDGSTMTIAELESGLATKLTKTDLDGYSTQTWTQNQIKMTADGINGTISSIKGTVDGQTTSINDLKADSSSFKGQFTTVNNTLGKQTTDISTLQATSKELTTGFNTLTTDNTTNKNDISQLKQTATEFNSTLMTVQTQVQNSAVGTNLLIGTSEDEVSGKSYEFTDYKISGDLQPGTTYTLSGLARVDQKSIDNGQHVFVVIYKRDWSWSTAWLHIDGSLTTKYNKITFTTPSGLPFNAVVSVYLSHPNDDGSKDSISGLGYISKVKLEKGSLATDWGPNPADNATVTALSKLSQTVDGMQFDISKKIEQKDLNGYATQTWTQSQIKSTADSINLNVSKVQTDLGGAKTQFAALEVKVNGIQTTVSGKADQSQVTQLANQITSTVIDLSAYNLITNTEFEDRTLNGWGFANPSLWSVGWNNSDVYMGSNALHFHRASTQTPIGWTDAGSDWIEVYAGQVVSASAVMYQTGPEGDGWTPTGLFTIEIDFYKDKTSGRMGFYGSNIFDIKSPYVKQQLKVENIKVPEGANYARFHVQTNGTGNILIAHPMLVKRATADTYVSGAVSQSQITQLSNDINLRVQKGDIINQINISPESILIAGQKVHITGQTSIDNAVIKDAMIADIKADKITAGTLNAANVNVINLNANNITTGTLKGANLSMNLNTGEILFQKGSIRSTNGNLNINIDDGSMSLTNSQGEGAYFIDGKIAMTKNDIWTNGAIHYGQLTFGNNIFGNALGSVSGVLLEGAGGVIVGNKEFNPLTLFGPGKTYPSGGGIAANNSFATVASNGWASIEGGTSYAAPFSTNNPSIVAGISGKYSAPGAWMPTSDKGAASFVKGKLVGLYAEDGGFSNDHGTTADLAAAVDGRSGYILSAATYARTYASGAQMTIMSSGVFGRISSASKYKLAIGEISTLNDEAHQFLSVKPKQWFDKSESEALADTMTTGNTDYIDDAKALPHTGFIAEDLYTAGLDNYVIRGNDGSIESIQYDRLPVLHHELIRELFNRLDAAEMEIYKLKQEVINNAN